jgi:hypothetical protein
MLTFLDAFTLRTLPQLTAALKAPIGGTPKAQQRYLDKVKAVPSLAIIDIGANLGSRCRFSIMVSVWQPDRFGGALVCGFMVIGEGPGRVRRHEGPIWRISRHALVRLVQRAGATDAVKLLNAMCALAAPITDGIAGQGLLKRVGVIKVPFEGGIAVVEKPAPGELVVVKTILPPGPEEAGCKTNG